MLVFNPLDSSGFAFQLKTKKWAIVDMGCPAGSRFVDRVAELKISLADISILALTHLHPDHIEEEGIAALVEQGQCHFICPKLCFEEIDVEGHEFFNVAVLLKKSGRLHIVEKECSFVIEETAVRCQPLVHIVYGKFLKGANVSYRMEGFMVSGDAPTRDIFSEENFPFLSENTDGETVKKLVLNLAQVGGDDLDQQNYFDEERKLRFLNAHGFLLDFLQALKNPLYERFFKGLEVLCITHIRRIPLEESFQLYMTHIKEVCLQRGFQFLICK